MTDNNYRKLNLAQRQKKLDAMIQCPSGQGQVYIRNFIEPHLRQKGPHLALRCKIRELLGVENPVLELEEIVLTCCRDPAESCEAYRQYLAKNAAG